MAAAGIVGDYKGSQVREALFTVEQWGGMRSKAEAEAGVMVWAGVGRAVQPFAPTRAVQCSKIACN